MARKSKGMGERFPTWATPMSEPIINPRQEPYIGPDNGPSSAARTARGMFDMLIPRKDKGYNIGTDGPPNKWYGRNNAGLVAKSRKR